MSRPRSRKPGKKRRSWTEAYELLLRYVEREGHARMSTSHREGGYGLGGWAYAQRKAYRRGTLSTVRIKMLERLPGWFWESLLASWHERYNQLCRVVEIEGHARIPDSYMDGDFKLGKWVDKQRQRFHLGVLSDDRIKKLEGLPGWSWVVFPDRWQEDYQRLARYIENEGDAQVGWLSLRFQF